MRRFWKQVSRVIELVEARRQPAWFTPGEAPCPAVPRSTRPGPLAHQIAISPSHVCHLTPSLSHTHALICPTGEHPGGWVHPGGPHKMCAICGPHDERGLAL